MHDRGNMDVVKNPSSFRNSCSLRKGRVAIARLFQVTRTPIATGSMIQSAMTEWTPEDLCAEVFLISETSFTLLDYEAFTVPLPTAPTATATRPCHLFPAGILLLVQDSQAESQVSSYHVTPCWLLQDKVPGCPLASMSSWVFVRSLVSGSLPLSFFQPGSSSSSFQALFFFSEIFFLFRNPCWHQLFFLALQALSFPDLNAELCDQTPNSCSWLMFLLEQLRTRHFFFSPDFITFTSNLSWLQPASSRFVLKSSAAQLGILIHTHECIHFLPPHGSSIHTFTYNSYSPHN